MNLETQLLLAIAILLIAVFYFYVLPRANFKNATKDKGECPDIQSFEDHNPYKWRCLICDEPGQTNKTNCSNCLGPSNISGDELIAWKNNWQAIQKSASPVKTFRCSKCHHTQFKTGLIRSAGGTVSASIEIETEQFTYMSCSHCGFTEFYNRKLSLADRFIDFAI
ncbi:MAG: putative nucleic-acid-binding Zn-ribbon protein [Bermanella sp.]|jgi:predicted nucleic-acid-binding Zn-ribbon protein